MVKELKIRIAAEADARKVFELSNEDEVRRNSIHSEKIEWESHLKWFFRALNDPDCIYYIAEWDGEFCGQVRFNRENSQWVVSISVVSSFRGRHIGSEILKAAVSKMDRDSVIAYVKERNIPSLRMFSGCGFRECCEKRINGEIYKLLRYVG